MRLEVAWRGPQCCGFQRRKTGGGWRWGLSWALQMSPEHCLSALAGVAFKSRLMAEPHARSVESESYWVPPSPALVLLPPPLFPSLHGQFFFPPKSSGDSKVQPGLRTGVQRKEKRRHIHLKQDSRARARRSELVLIVKRPPW